MISRDRDETKQNVHTIFEKFETIRRVLGKVNIRTTFTVDNTLKRILTHAKDRINRLDRTDLVYKIQCRECPSVYVGQTSQHLRVKINKHKRYTKTKPTDQQKLQKLERDSAIALHSLVKGHQIDFDSVVVL